MNETNWRSVAREGDGSDYTGDSVMDGDGKYIVYAIGVILGIAALGAVVQAIRGDA
jgi:hypothetical protein